MRGKLGCAMLAAGLAAALGTTSLPASAEEPGLLALGLGAYEFLHDARVAQGRIEYRFPQQVLLLKPLVGALATTDGTVYAYGGLRLDLALGEHYVLMPVAAAGYFHRGAGKDLGSHLEFKTGLEVAYRFDDMSRIGVAFDHMSNAGLRKRNPGTESLLLTYSIPIGPAS